MRTTLATLCCAVLLSLTGCGGDTTTPVARQTPAESREAPTGTPVPTDLTCTTGESVSTDGGLLSALPDGYDTREEAADAWLAGHPEFGETYVLTADGTGAWLLRGDGTAQTKVDFLEHSGFTAHGYTTCA